MRFQAGFPNTLLFEIFEIVDFGDVVIDVKLETDSFKFLIFRVIVVIIDLLIEILSQSLNILFVGDQLRFLFG